jgi:hypothetical protein
MSDPRGRTGSVPEISANRSARFVGVLFAELDRGLQKPSETEFVAVGVN